MSFHDVTGLIISLVFIAICIGAVGGIGYGIVSTIRDLRA